MKGLLALLTAILAVALVAPGASAVAGSINLSWNDCGAFGAGIETFSCDTNAGHHTIVGSFVAPTFVDSVTAGEIVMDVQSETAVLPDWWQLRTASCRAASLTSSFDFTAGPSSCYDYWQGGAVGGIAMDPPVGNRTRIKAVIALPTGDPRIASVPQDIEVYLFKATISNAKTAGSGACAGCDAGVCIVLDNIKLYQPFPNPTYFLSSTDYRLHATWQCPGEMAIADPGGLVFCKLECATPARPRTWGQIKQLYR